MIVTPVSTDPGRCQRLGCEPWTCDHGDHVATHIDHVEGCPDRSTQT